MLRRKQKVFFFCIEDTFECKQKKERNMVGGGGDNTVRRRVVSENSTNEQQVDAADEHALLINNSAKKSVVDKLFSSKEETTFIIPHFHKILGFSCLASFLYRFSYIGHKDGNFGPHYGTLVFILMHLALNLSSFNFFVPKKRIQNKDGGYRIWAEYRAHGLVFSGRNLAFMFLIWLEQRNQREYSFMDLPLVLATCAAADFGTCWLGPEFHSDTVRDGKFTDPFMNWFASESQMWLTGICLVGYHSYSFHLVTLAIIQFNAFLMTLRRKQVASAVVLMSIYGITLVAGFGAIALFDSFSTASARRGVVGACFGTMGCILRMGPLHMNKYVMWTLLGLVWYAIKMNLDESYQYNSAFWMVAYCVLKTISSWLGFQKRMKAPPEERSDDTFKVVLLAHAGFYMYAFFRLYVAKYHDMPF